MFTDKESFQFKADFMPLTVVKLKKCDLDSFSSDLKDTVAKAPKYFTNAPVIIDVNQLNKLDTLDLTELCKRLKEFSIIPVGIKGLPRRLHEAALSNGLAILASSEKKKPITKTEPESSPSGNTKVITKPVRSGTQIYAKNSDLIVLASVNPGAEIIADGNIHVYGPLKGRALAGARGDVNARIFCAKLEAELISIAGHYLVKESVAVPKSKKPMLQIFLSNQTICIEGI